jgi:hypothetical protein
MTDPQWVSLRFVRLDGSAAVEAFLAEVGPAAAVGTGDDPPG